MAHTKSAVKRLATSKKANLRNRARISELKTIEKKLRAAVAAGDAAAAEFYQVFKEQPELAEFLRKLDALRSVMKGRTTVVFDTAVPPFDLLKPGAGKIPAVK